MGEPYLGVNWTDPVTSARGYLVLDRLQRGAASGGLRMWPGCTGTEVAALARVMTTKEALLYRPGDRYRPYGGGKGGIDYDPAASGARGVLRRYLRAMRPLIESCWAMGEDLGVQQQVLDELAHEVGLRSTVQCVLNQVPDGEEAGLHRLGEAFATSVDGVPLADSVGGYGVAAAAASALVRGGRHPGRCTAAVQGFGSIGGATARYLARAGVTVVAVADRTGTVINPDGLDVERMLADRLTAGGIDRDKLGPSDRLAVRGDWLAAAVDVLVPAAVSHAIDAVDCDRIRARYVVEGANVALAPAADKALRERGVVVVPDAVANCGANGWWWWTLFGDIDAGAQQALARVGETVTGLVDQVWAIADREGEDLRNAAHVLARRNLAAINTS